MPRGKTEGELLWSTMKVDRERRNAYGSYRIGVLGGQVVVVARAKLSKTVAVHRYPTMSEAVEAIDHATPAYFRPQR